MTKQLIIILCSVFIVTLTLLGQNKKNKDNEGIISAEIYVDSLFEDTITELEPNWEEANQMRIDEYLDDARYSFDQKGYTDAIQFALQMRIDEYLEDVRYSFDQKEYTDAIQFALNVLELDSTNTQAHIWCGIVYRNINLYQQAFAHFDKGVELLPNALMYGNRGSLTGELGYDSIAILDYNKAIELNPEYAHAYNNRGALYLDQEQNEKALENLSMAIELNPELPHSYMNRGEVYFILGELEQALENYDMAIYYMLPELGNALYRKGLTLVRLQRMQEAKDAFEQAIEAYTEALEKNIYDYHSILSRGEVYEQLGNYELALPDYELALEKYQELVKQNPKSPVMIYHRACAYKGLKQYDKALADLQQVLQLRPLYKQAERDIKEIQKLKEVK